MIKGGLGEYLTPCDKAAALRLTVTSMRHACATRLHRPHELEGRWRENDQGGLAISQSIETSETDSKGSHVNRQWLVGRITCRGNTLHARGLTQLSCWKCPQLNIRPNQLGIRKKWAGIRKDQGEGVGSGRGTP